ncbi:MAG TPA: glutamine synthetase family protein [Candidatus Acidoferrales bacterium]|nr:glutamine synthetase family protein [Candidatus Acidoferrales bacterium]
MTKVPKNFTPEQLLQLVKERGVNFIDLQFTDVGGAVKNVTIPTRELEATLNHGIWFDGSSIEGFARIAESDMYLIPDTSTFAVLPWLSGDETTARLICDVYTPDSQPFLGDPRAVLKHVLAEAEKMGFIYNTGPELEFFVLKPSADEGIIPPRPQDSASYFDQPIDMIATSMWRQVTEALEAFGIETEAMHHEVATGQHEIDFRYSNALKTADNAVTFRVVVKVIVGQKGLYATFMPKPIRGISGSGMHVHQSLTYKANGTNAFSDPGDPHGLSKIAKHFIAGQLAHARGMCAVLAPLTNSYKRLVAGYEAPVYISWGRINRSALIRIPRAHTHESTRLELRCPDPSCNPYLAFAVMLAAGLDGIRRELPIPEATEEDVYLIANTKRGSKLDVLPGSLEEAIVEMEKDAVVRDALGAHTFERFISAKRLEWEDYRLEVTPWELDKYLPNY